MGDQLLCHGAHVLQGSEASPRAQGLQSHACGDPVSLSVQLFWLLILSAPVACASWTVTHEDVFAEFRTWCQRRRLESRRMYARKFFYVFTCQVLLQSLRGRGRGWPHRLQAPGDRVARSAHRMAVSGVGRERLHESVRPAAARHQTGARRDQRRRTRSRPPPPAALAARPPHTLTLHVVTSTAERFSTNPAPSCLPPADSARRSQAATHRYSP